MLPFLLSPLGKRIALAVAVLLLLFSAYKWAYSKGNAAGYGEGQRTQLELDKQSFQQDRKQFLDTLSAAQKVNDEAQQKIAEKNSQLAKLQSRRDANRKAIQSLPDASLIPDIHSRLGRPDAVNPTSAPTLSTTDLRDIALRLSDLSSLEERVGLLQAKSEQQDIRISAIIQQRDAAVSAYNKLVPLYAKAYLAAQKHHSVWVKIFTLGIVRDRKLDLPEPVVIK